jgi:hypothetical protein
MFLGKQCLCPPGRNPDAVLDVILMPSRPSLLKFSLIKEMAFFSVSLQVILRRSGISIAILADRMPVAPFASSILNPSDAVPARNAMHTSLLNSICLL